MKQKGIITKLLLVAATLIVAGTLTACGSNNSSNSGSSYKSELSQSGKLTIGLEGTYAPYSYRKDGKLTGFEVDLGKAIAKKLDVKANFVPTKWDSLIAGLGSSKFDVVLNNVTVTNERKKSYAFASPYIFTQYVLITKSGNNSIKSLNDIKGKKFAEGTGTNNEDVAKKHGAVTVPSEQFVNSLSMIRQGRVQGTVNALDAWNSYAKEQSTKGLKARAIPASEEPFAEVSPMLNKDDTKLKAKISNAIKELRKDGELAKISKRYFGKDVTNENN